MTDLTIHELQNTATTPANDDYMVLDGSTAGTSKITVASLATWIRNKWAAFINAITPLKTSFANGDKFPVVNGSTATAMEVSKLLELTAQNALAGNVAPAFDPTKPNDAGGYAYYKDEIVAYNGATYKFKVNHASGAWDAIEVDSYDAGEYLKLFLVTNNPEYVFAITDKNDRFLFGVKKDGSVEWQKGIPFPLKNALSEKIDKEIGKSLINTAFAQMIHVEANQEYNYAVLDSGNRFLFGIKKDGSFEWSKGIPSEIKKSIQSKVDKETGKSLIDSNFAQMINVESSQEYVYVVLDENKRLLFGVKKTGDFVFGNEIPSSVRNEIERIDKYLNDTTFGSNAFQVMPRCLCIGDSLSAGYSTYNGVKIKDDTAKKNGINWPSYVAKRNKIYFKNIANEGATAKRFREGVSLNQLTGIFDGIFIALGCNDRNVTDLGAYSDIAVDFNSNADTFYGNYDYVVRKSHSLCPNAKIFVMTMPDYVIGASSYNVAIRYIASLYSYVYLLDLSKEEIYKTDFLQTLITDGTHFSPYGYEVVSHAIENCVNKLYLDYGENFRTFDSSEGCFAAPGQIFDSSRNEYVESTVDCAGRLLEAIDKNGHRLMFTRPEFKKGVEWTNANIDELVLAMRDAGYNI